MPKYVIAITGCQCSGSLPLQKHCQPGCPAFRLFGYDAQRSNSSPPQSPRRIRAEGPSRNRPAAADHQGFPRRWSSEVRHPRRVMRVSGAFNFATPAERAGQKEIGALMAKNVHGRLSTDTKDLRTLCDEIWKGEVKVPQFQRRFVWKEQQALDLLDSVANNYPIGSLLLWKTKSKMRVERDIGAFKLPETDDVEPTDYVLDGQQRLTVVFSCLGAKPTDKGFAAGYDLEKEEFIKLPEKSELHIFPLRRLFNTTALLDFRQALLSHHDSALMHSRLDALVGTLTNYKIPVVTLKDLTVEEVCPIFERINSSGTALSTYDLMVAATWTEKFDLNEQTEVVQEALRPKGFQDIEGGTILKCLSAIQFRGIKRDQVLALRELGPDDMGRLVDDTKRALLRTVDLLSTEFNVYCWEFLPYEALAVILSYVHAKTGRALEPQQVTRVRQWFWRSAFNERYRGASEHFVSSDLEKIHAFVVEQRGRADQFGGAPVREEWATTGFQRNFSRSRGFVLALSMLKPRNITNGSFIDISEALSIYNQKEFHHIHPRAHLKKSAAKPEHNCIANICMLAASENKSISDKDPKAYLPACVSNLGADASAVFASNLLPDPGSFDYLRESYESFLEQRSVLICRLVTRLCDGMSVS
jgi:hypothetical protein